MITSEFVIHQSSIWTIEFAARGKLYMTSRLFFVSLPLLLLFSHWVVSDSSWPNGLQHSKLISSLLTSRVCSNSCPLSQWCHPIISSSVFPFSSLLQSFPASGSFPMSLFFPSGRQSIGASASASSSVLLMNIQDWSPLGWTGWIS